MRHLTTALLQLCFWASSEASAMLVQRCESAQGRLTFTHLGCPEGTVPSEVKLPAQPPARSAPPPPAAALMPPAAPATRTQAARPVERARRDEKPTPKARPKKERLTKQKKKTGRFLGPEEYGRMLDSRRKAKSPPR